MAMPGLDGGALFLLGLLGTGHCLGMCGPLVLAIPGPSGRLSAHLWYHVGRIATYSLVGGLLGALGQGLISLQAGPEQDAMTALVRGQVFLSLFAGLFLIFFGLLRLGFLKEPAWMRLVDPGSLPGYATFMKRAVTGRTWWGMAGAGLFMGFLPCGLSYAAFSRALPAGGFSEGVILLAAFGLGTLPGLLLPALGLARVLFRHRVVFESLSGMLMVGMGVDLLLKAII